MAIIKLCGLRTYADALLVNEVQPDYAGFIFAYGKRQITVETACNLSRVIKGSRLVGVFVNEQPARILSIAKQVSLDVIQLHGEETDEELRLLKQSCTCEIWKALRIQSIKDITKNAYPHADHLLLDSYVQGMQGGSGKRIAMDILQGLDVSECIIAGGISLDNVDEVLALRPYGIDVSSSLETDGKKDKKKVHAFMKHVNI